MKGPHLPALIRDAGLNCMGLGRGSQSTPAVQADRCRKAEERQRHCAKLAMPVANSAALRSINQSIHGDRARAAETASDEAAENAAGHSGEACTSHGRSCQALTFHHGRAQDGGCMQL